MKLKMLLIISFVVSCRAADISMPRTPQERERRYLWLNERISRLKEQLEAGVSVPRNPEQAFELSEFAVAVSPKAEISDADALRQQIRELKQEMEAIKQTAANSDDEWVWQYISWVPSRENIRPSQIPAPVSEEGPVIGAGVTETADDREWLYNHTLREASENDKEIHLPEILSRARAAGDAWVAALDSAASRPHPPAPATQTNAGAAAPPSQPPSSSWITPKRAAIAVGLLTLGYLFQRAPEWIKNRVKRILKEHGKKLSDLDPAEKDLLVAASYARFNPAGAFFFQEAVLDMPEGAEFRSELWPVLNHVYYGKRCVSRKQAHALRKLYDEAKELMVVD